MSATLHALPGAELPALDAAPGPDLHLAYAWGHRGQGDGNQSANHGALRDRWHHRSWAVKGGTLRRFALPGRVPLYLDNT